MSAITLDAPVEIVETDHEPYVRAAGDKLRVIIAAVVFVVALVTAAVLSNVIHGAEQDVTKVTEQVKSAVPERFAAFLISIGQYMGVLAPIALAVAVAYLRRLRVAIMVLIAMGASCAGLYLASTVLTENPVALPANLGQIRGITFPGPYFLAMGAAVVVVVGPWFNRGLRRLGVGTIILVGVTRIASGGNQPYDIVMSAALGWLVGAIVVAIFGSPNRHPRGTDVAEALVRSGVDVVRLEYTGPGVRGSTIYLADTVEGLRRFVKVFSSDQRDADLLLQMVRWFRVRDASEAGPFSSVRRGVEHEALIALKATADGIPTAPLVSVAEVEPEGMLLAFENLEGDALLGAGPDRLTDDLLRKVWEVVAAMQHKHLAHRDLRLAHFIVDDVGQVKIVDFSFAELAAHPAQLRADIAELLCATAVEVGAERAVAAAIDVLGQEAIGASLSRIVPLALTSHTRKAIGAQGDLLEQVQAQVQEACGIDEVHYEELARVKPRTVAYVAIITIAVYALLPRVSDIGSIRDQIANMNPLWLIPIVLFQCSTYVGAGLGMVGSVPDRVPLLPTIRLQVAAAFVDVLAPAGLGGMALNTRFMQKRGVDPAVAVAGVGVNAVGGIIGHVLLLGGFLLWAGTNSFDAAKGDQQTSISLPGWQTIGIAVVIIMIIIGIALAIPAGRTLFRERIRPMVGDALRGLAQLSRKPVKLFEVVGGSMIVTLGFTGAFICTVQALGGGVPIAQLGAAYLLAWAVAVFAPTPGGLGALEVALIAGLGRLGVNPEVAVSSVLVFRTFTFWLPVLPGWGMLTWLQRKREI